MPASSTATDRAAGVPTASAEITREVRLAVVMYGGVSLAIYINGVTQELLRLVRATAPSAPGRNDLRLADADLRGTERVYRRIARLLGGDDGPATTVLADDAPVRVRFVVDTISGSSAGGINGIFLAKALANDQSLDKLETLWVEEGDIGRLLNDKRSRVADTWVKEQDPPASLLNSARMYQRLVSAFDGMGSTEGVPLVSEVDLFVTTTDIRGLPINLRLADGLVAERRHKHAFQFKFRDIGGAGQESVNDFTQDRNRLLAFAARCTSSFPVAFEPMTVAAAAAPNVSPSDRLRYVSDAECADVADFFPQYRDAAAAAGQSDTRRYLEHRPFGDGGYLDNKPFGYPIDALVDRHGGFPADRKLVYVEPSPDRVGADGEIGRDAMPGPFENANIALSLARQETIREDLLRVLDRNHLVERIEHVTAGIEEDVAELQRCDARIGDRHPDFADLGLEDLMCGGGGIAYGGYHRLKVAAITDELARFVANTFNLQDTSGEYVAVRRIVRNWREFRYAPYRRSLAADRVAGGDTFAGTQNRFLAEFDLSYRVRRLSFVLNKIDHLLCLDTRARAILLIRAGCPAPETDDDKAAFRAVLTDVRAQLMPELRRLRVLHDALFEPRGTWRHDRAIRDLAADEGLAGPRATLDATVPGLAGALGPDGWTQLRTLLAKPSEQEQDAEARRLLEPGPGSFREHINATADALATLLRAATLRAREHCEHVLGVAPLGAAVSQPIEAPARDLTDCGDYAAVARRVVADYYTGFDPFDLVLFPALYETGLGDEVARVDVLRISPEDATALIDLREGRGRAGAARRKLAGDMLGHFGAFLDASFRTNDILWGRLDGAERLITMLLPGPALADLRARLVGEAHEAILAETFAERQRAEVATRMASALLRDGGATVAPSQPDVSESVHRRAVTQTLAALLEPAALRAYFARAYTVDRTLDGRTTMDVGARATAVVGRMLDGLDRQPPGSRALAKWLTRGGRGLWTLVELSVPRSPTGYLARHWIGLLVLFALVLIVGGSVFASQSILQFGFTLLGVTLAVRVLMLALADAMRARPTWHRVAGYTLVILVFVGLVVFGGQPLAAWIHERVVDVARVRA